MAEEDFSHTLSVPGNTVIPELGLEVETRLAAGFQEPGDTENYLWQAEFDYDKIKPVLTVRNRRPADTLCPSGMAGRSKKLQDYLVDEKVPRRQRNRVPLLCSGADILWVVGHRTDARFIPGPDAKTVLHVRVRARS
jgi:tRNA(Ile)-lysidine synthase